MKKTKAVGVIWFSIMSGFLCLDQQAYYYGFGYGILSSHVPSRFAIRFSGSDLGNQGVGIKENDMGLNILTMNYYNFMSGTENKIYAKKFIGYWFNDETIVAKIKDDKDKTRYIEIYEEMTNALHPDFICKEMKYPPGEYDNLKYIDLDKSLNYFKRFRLIKNFTFLLFVFISFYGIRLLSLRCKRKE